MIRTNTTRTLIPLLMLALLGSAAPAMADKYYKWVDDNGVTHYGTAPPEAGASEAVRTYGPSSDQGKELKALQEQREAAARAREQAQQQAREAERAAEEPEAVAEERCEEHRKNLDILENKPIVRVENPQTGEMEVIDQSRREQLIKETRAGVEFCEARNG
ncbi:MAG TPA: DUF4124 domain-containing protein [Alcanivorax sp.]|nr:DUF4124 domain-containing protein [Alcanivorax sp.]